MNSGNQTDGSWTPFDHTADLGVDITAPTLPELFRVAAAALFDQMIGLEAVVPARAFPVSVTAANREELMVRWLAELLYLHDAQDLLFSRFEMEHVEETSLRGVAWGEPFDAARHQMKTGIKAVTYHQIEVRPDAGGWRGRVIFDV